MFYRKDQTVIFDRYTNYSTSKHGEKYKSFVVDGNKRYYTNPKLLDKSNNDELADAVKKIISKYKQNKTFCEIFSVKQNVRIDEKTDYRTWKYARVGSIAYDKTVIYYSKPILDIEDIGNLFLELDGACSAFTKEYVTSLEAVNVDANDVYIFSPQASAYIAHEILGHCLEEDYYNQYTNAMIKNAGDSFKNENILFKEINSIESYNLRKIDDYGTNVLTEQTLYEDGIVKGTISSKMYGDKDSIRIPRMAGTILSGNYKKHYYPERYIKVHNISSGYIDFINKKIVLIIELSTFVKGRNVVRIPKNMLELDWNDFFDAILDMRDDINIYQNFCVKNGQIADVFSGAPTMLMKGFRIKII